jgi:TolA-binding protein
MEESMNDLKELAQEAARVEDELARPLLGTEAAREAFVAGVAQMDVRRRYRLASPRVLVPVMAAAAVVGAVLIHLAATSAFSPEVPDAQKWVQAPRDESRTMTFEDGSAVRFEQASKGRVGFEMARGGRVILESGSADIHVIHRDGVEWSVLAGPYRVRVTGTRFDVAWDAEYQRFTLQLHDGEVVVTGPLMEEGQVVRSGRILSASLIDERLELKKVPSDDEGPDETAETPKSDDDRTYRKTRHQTGWVNRDNGDDCAAIVAEAEKFGVQRLARSVDAQQLLTVGTAARQCHRLDLADSMYETLRTRFPGTGHAATAAFYLGRMAFDQHGRYDEAVRWFETYLHERKGETLAREATGRLMEAHIRAGNAAAARRTAATYLRDYPDGPHARRAREIATP